MTLLRHALLVAAIACLLTKPAFSEEESLGRLFYTPSQRAALNANIRSVTKTPKPRTPIPRSVTLSGVVTRSDGERTVWIDGRAYHQGNPDDVRVITQSDDPASAELKVRGVRNRVPVRVGQQLDPISGNTFEPYETPKAGAQGR
jgi:hypothetical protein